VIATGEQHSVRDFVNAVAHELGLAITWRGMGREEAAYDGAQNRIIALDARYLRPAEVDTLLGDATRAREKLGWKPKVSFRDLVAEMARQDLAVAERDALVQRHGYKLHRSHE
jgi:GDPmannose 4,6-dehydratase